MQNRIINNRYKAVRELKEARDGKLYWLVEDQNDGNALRMMKGIGLFGQQQKEDAQLEVDLLNSLDLDYIVKLYDNFKFKGPDDLPYHALVLEYLEGGDLSQFLKEMLEKLAEGGEQELPWSQNEALRITSQLVLATDYLHGKNIIHRDIKPENILLSADKMTVKIADFNISRAAESTIHTGVAGTMDYLPPEAIKSQKTEQVSFRRDMWGLGIVMQMLCTFRHPFATGEPFETMMNIVQNIRRPAEVIFPQIESLIQQCLVIDIGERAASAAVLMAHPALVSLIDQLKNRVLPKDLIFGLSRNETTRKINEMLNAENIQLKNEVAKLSADRDLLDKKLKKETEEFKKQNEKSKRETEELKQRNNSLNNNLHDAEAKSRNLLQIVCSFGPHCTIAGLGFYTGNDAKSVRRPHDEVAVRRVLRAMAANLTEFNLKFWLNKNLVVSEGGWTIRHQTYWKCEDGDGVFWKLWLLYNGKRVDFQADADDIHNVDGKSFNSAKKLTPDSKGMVKLKGETSQCFVRWNIKILK